GAPGPRPPRGPYEGFPGAAEDGGRPGPWEAGEAPTGPVRTALGAGPGAGPAATGHPAGPRSQDPRSQDPGAFGGDPSGVPHPRALPDPSDPYDDRFPPQSPQDASDTSDADAFDTGDHEDTVRLATAARRRRRGSESVRHAYYPGRRMHLGVVLLPLRVFLGLISIYAGMGKLSDPVYFDGGERGSMVTWLRSLHPWPVARPLLDVALAHPVGAGLTVAFLEIVVGVLTVLGLWQRLAAAFGALLSAALLMTVSWRTVPAYDAPDIIYLAAWSPLVIAGAPVYSADARLAGEAWRRLGPRAALWDLRRRVLRRGGMMAALVAGVTLLFGSMIGGAVRSSHTVTVPGPHDPPRNYLPGSPLPERHHGRHATPRVPAAPSQTAPADQRSARPSASAPAAVPSATSGAGMTGGGQGRPSHSKAVPGRDRPTAQTPRKPRSPAATAGPTGGASHGGGTGAGSGAPDTSSGGYDTSGGALGGLLG
ncbi:DoxX family protein, partial [Streptomyces sp. B1866]|uniref:DoxX family protein n=1 Tax=Streptomyces sp. B1866 TaxID=3075431 RepID=UPI002892232D